MSFNLANWGRQSVTLNTGEVLVDGVAVGAPGMFSYRSSTDTFATVSGANYFSGVAFDLYVADLIYVQASDASGWLNVATVDRTVNPATITTVTAGFTGSVGTANIINGNVTTAKLAANAVGSAQLAATVLQYAAVPITAVQFNGMYAAPMLLVAAGGANTLIELDRCVLLETYNSAAYAAGGTVAVQYDSTVNGAGVIASSTIANTAFQGTASTSLPMNSGTVAQPFTTCVNKGLYLSNISGAFTTGNSAFVAHVWYKVIPTV